jgi:hypothetical protein
MHTQRASSWLSVAVAVQCILLWVRLLYFSRAFRSTRFDLVESLQAVLVHVRWYLLVMLLLMWGFACGFYVLFRQVLHPPHPCPLCAAATCQPLYQTPSAVALRLSGL